MIRAFKQSYLQKFFTRKYKVIVPDFVVSKTKSVGFNQPERLENLKRKLETNPYAGKRLAKNLFEKKWGAFRIYYIVLEKRSA